MKNVVGENYLCFYCLLEMILNDVGEVQWTQYSLADLFGVVLPTGHSIDGVNNIKICEDEKMQGAHIDCASLNLFMLEEDIPLKVSYIPANPYGEYEFEGENLQDKYIIYTYSYGALYREKEKLNVGHASLLVDYIGGNKLKIYDPGPRGVGEKDVYKYMLYDAMYDAKGGMYIFEKVKNMKRCFISREKECLANCQYCFGKWDSYIKFNCMDNIEDDTIIYPNCDGNMFDENWEQLLDRLRGIKNNNIVISVSTKFDIEDNILMQIKELNEQLMKNDSMVKLSVSFSCVTSCSEFERGTSSYDERIMLIKKISSYKIPYFTIIKPILPFINFSEYKKIIDDTIVYSPIYVIGDLYVNENSNFYKQYIYSKNYQINKRNVEWNGDNGAWSFVKNDVLKDEIRQYIQELGGHIFNSDRDAIIYIKRKLFKSKGDQKKNEQRVGSC